MAVDKGSAPYRKLSTAEKKALMYINLNKDDLVKGKCMCARCNKPCSFFYYITDAASSIYCALCIKCALELNPPKWQIVIATVNEQLDNRIEPIGNYDIWDDTNKRKENTLTISELIECGWFIRKVTETSEKVPKRTIKKIHLEYYGKNNCIRFRDHYEKLGLEHLTQCNSPFCEFVYQNIKGNKTSVDVNIVQTPLNKLFCREFHN